MDFVGDFTATEERILKQYREAYPGVAQAVPLLDIHKITTAITLGCMYSGVSKDQRRVGKSLNFSSLYTPGARWEVPQEAALMKIWTDRERAELVMHFGITDTATLYSVLVNYFNTNLGRQ
ncbi:hypothetical protein HOS55_gp061 [Pseudomonas phage PMBT3]|uniref:Uncharacterized protein n=1 Tax=Pseudomonas phage PMBT3 TaxID=2059856 RepID=A0A2I6PHY7_9CAUD|nr:hypothetical protein HOS55_gp061 [Pseudomonas phage PMBT3]AUM59663.1 hypothetical protein [Pseudomonas phage PMBT3]